MRKIFYFMLLLTTMITFSACSNDKNALSGTTWIASYGDDTSFVIEFEDGSTVSGFRAKKGTLRGSVYYGSYSFTDNTIVFDDFTIDYSYLHFHFTNGTVSGNYMTLNYFMDSEFYAQMTFRKQ